VQQEFLDTGMQELRMKTNSLVGCSILAVAVLIGVIAVSALRLVIYKTTGAQPDMGAEMFLFFAPVVAMPIIAVVLLVHIAARSWFNFHSAWQWAAAGLGYSLVSLALIRAWLAIPAAVAICLLVLWLRRLRPQRTDDASA